MAFVQVFKKVPIAPVASSGKPGSRQLTGKTVFWKNTEGKTLAGQVISANTGTSIVQLAAPYREKELVLSESTITVPTDLLAPVELSVHPGSVKSWEQSAMFKNKFIAVREDGKEDGRIKDYLDIEIDGYGSTFDSFTKSDRAGDSILPSAFDQTLDDFKRNPVMLRDHWMDTDHTIGKWTTVETDAKGLHMVGRLSNADDVRNTRFKIAEGILTTLSIGGMFMYQEDGSTIEKIYLYETSVVVVPCNPDATFTVRALDTDAAAKAFDFRKFFHG